MAAAAAIGLAACSASASSSPTTPTTVTLSTIATTEAPTTTSTTIATTTTEAPSTTTTVVKVPITRTLSSGSNGADVKMVQQRLKDLHFDPGPLDGRYGTTTVEAIWAYQHLNGLPDDGKVTPDLWSRLQDPWAPTEMEADGGPNHVEIDLKKQVLVLYQNDTAALITHISSGTGKPYCEKGFCSVAGTPGGAYAFTWRHTGWLESRLGQLYNPVFFNQGIAVHGSLSVPDHPASHGCIRIPMHIAEYFPSLVSRGDGVFVFDGVKTPRQYGAQAPPGDTKDPNYVDPNTTTTGATNAPVDATTIPVPTTIPATTTVPGSTTVAPTTVPPTTATTGTSGTTSTTGTAGLH